MAQQTIYGNQLAIYTNGASPPTNPIDGDRWLNTGDGVIYTYMVDANGAQWVSFGGSTIPADLSVTTLAVSGVSKFSDNIVVPKTSGKGIEVDTSSPSFPFKDMLGPIVTTGGTVTWTTFRGAQKAYQFSAPSDDSWLTFHVPHDYLAGSDVYAHVHWAHNLTTVTGGSVTWQFETTVAKGHQQGANSVFSADKTTSVTQTCSPTTQYEHFIAETVISSTGGSATLIDNGLLEPDSIILLHLSMSANNLTVSGGPAAKPFVFFCDIHYQSTGIGTKNKSPNFYT